MSERTDLLEESAIETFSHPVELGRVVDGETPRHSRSRQVLVKCVTEVFAPTVRAKHLDRLTMLLGKCPSLETPVRAEGLCLGVKEVSDCVLSSVVSERDEVPAATLARDRTRPPYIHMHLLPEVLHLRANTRLQDGLASCSSENAAITWRFARIGVQLDPKD